MNLSYKEKIQINAWLMDEGYRMSDVVETRARSGKSAACDRIGKSHHFEFNCNIVQEILQFDELFL